MDVPPQPDALALPTRKRLFAELSELRRPAGTEELAGRVGLHPNGVRTQLERLREAGLVSRARVSRACASRHTGVAVMSPIVCALTQSAPRHATTRAASDTVECP